jgi:hypothetical protein
MSGSVGDVAFGAGDFSSTITAATGSSFGTLTLADGSITDSSGTISFGNEHLNTTGDITADNLVGTTYTSTSANVTGCTALNSGYAAQYLRAGNVVTVSGKVDVTGSSGTKRFTLTLPIASTNGNTENCIGTITGGVSNYHGVIIGGLLDKADVYILEPTGSFNATGFYYHYTYVIN